MRFNLLIFFISFLLLGCEQQLKLNGENKQLLRSSIAEVRDSLSFEKQQQFDEAIDITMFNSINFDEYRQLGERAASRALEKRICRTLDGKTAEQVINEAKKIKIDRLAFDEHLLF
ncbi:MAG TPA: DUF6694 family lipoprotein [Arsenophonus nasoniae]|uniref:Lipoprotein n=1 Tax=Arsenophonus nasoniae TaxID=638 RepID=A0AA95GHB1_9GAMM|nr:DUF6694 family lipoprotein [Arsenophonus nasoniae]WGL94511.1 hypothetical protein QE207_12410 [Arsenophonus nasoniae]